MGKLLFHIVMGFLTGGLWWAFLVVKYVTR